MGVRQIRKLLKISWNNSLFTRVMLTFIAILLPLYLLGIFIYTSALQSVRTEIINSMNSQVSFYMSSLEKEIQRIRLLEYDMINDTNLNRLSAIPQSLGTIEKMQAISNLQKRLTSVRSSSLYIRDLNIHIPAINRSVNDSRVDEFDHDAYQALLSDYNPEREIQFREDSLDIITGSPFIDGANGDPVYIFDIILDTQSFRDALKQFDKYPGSGSLLYNTENGKIIAAANVDSSVETQIINKTNSDQQGITTVTDGGKTLRVMFISVSSQSLGMTLKLYVPENVVFASMLQYRKWFWIFSFVAAAVIVSFSFSIYRFIHKPLMQLVDAFAKVEDGNLDVSIEHYKKDEFRYLYRRFNAMVENLGTLIQQVYTMKILTQKAELKQLQSQINPHFLYNSFFMLHRMVQAEDYANLSLISEQLGRYFKYITRSATDEVMLSEEVEHARIYADIQALRFYNRIKVEFGKLPEEFRGIPVPRLILQPIIENSIEHGMKDVEEGGVVKIAFMRNEDGLTIVVEDNGNGIRDDELKDLSNRLDSEDDRVESTGIINIHRRIRLKFGKESGMVLSRGKDGGVRTEIRIRVGEKFHV